MPKLFKKLFLLTLALYGLSSCGGEGISETTGEDLGDFENILGSITSQTGNQADMNGWVIVATNKKTNISRVSEVNAAGLFSLPHIFMGQTYTLNLVSPAYIISSVLSMPSPTPNTIRQYFKFQSKTLPRLIHKGPIVTFQNENGISMQKDLASDADGDAIPDGIVSLSLFNNSAFELDNTEYIDYNESVGFNLAPTSTADIDLDGIKNIDDPDIDGDGLPNIFDSDDDGDAIYDVFDQDSDGDLIPDASQVTSDLYFESGVEWVTVRFEMIPQSDGTFKSSLIFVTKIRPSATLPTAVQIRGAPALLNGANVETIDSEENVATQAWDRRLKDDGKSEDASENDLLFARKVILSAGAIPTFHQVVFFQLAYGSGDSTWFKEYAYTFPPLTPSKITPGYDAISRNLTLVGNPFGDIQDFIWTGTIFDTETGLKIHSTAATLGTTRQIQLPSNILETGKTYKYKITAQVLDRIPGYASYTIESLLNDLK